MLIRLAGHFIDNPNHIDKLICIKGLPDEWFFKTTKYGKELIKPWVPDIDVNIPKDIRHLCDPIEVVQYFPSIAPGKEGIVDKLTVLGLKMDYMTEAGQTMWEKIERYLERAVPRDQMIQKPVLVAPNQKSLFDPHEARRTTRGSLEMRKTEIPVIDLTPPVVAPAPIVVNTVPVIQVQPSIMTAANAVSPILKVTREAPTVATVRCEPCGKDFNERGLRMHNMKKHPSKEPVGV